ncbi:MAG TPA: TlpA disulfide reductase family protein [Sedimentisphaerales bacterium]|nr:TlpA disulfide reductase family protein [Sedimentisphaerales bacterium]
MAMRNRHGIYWITALFLAVVLVLGVLHGCKRQQEEPNQPVSPNNGTAAPAARTAPVDPIQAAASLFREPKASLQAIINGATQRWDAIARDSWGTLAPDFTLTDLDGNPHKLSDYRGRDVIVAFWATTHTTCKLQIPALKELRTTYAKDKLAILSVSNEPAGVVKGVAAEQGIDYTVLLNPGSLAAPYREIGQYVPSCLFIDPEGRIKLAIRGVVPAADAKAILQAQ